MVIHLKKKQLYFPIGTESNFQKAFIKAFTESIL